MENSTQLTPAKIPAAIKTLQEKASYLDDRVSLLLSRIEAICPAGPVQDKAGSPTEAPACKLHGELVALIERVQQISNRVDSSLANLQL